MYTRIPLDCVNVNGLVVGSNRAVSRLTRKTKFRGLSRLGSTACNRKNIWSPHPTWLNLTTPDETTIYIIFFERYRRITRGCNLRIFSNRRLGKKLWNHFHKFYGSFHDFCFYSRGKNKNCIVEFWSWINYPKIICLVQRKNWINLHKGKKVESKDGNLRK